MVTVRADVTWPAISRIEALSSSEAAATVCALLRAFSEAVATVWLLSLTAAAELAM